MLLLMTTSFSIFNAGNRLKYLLAEKIKFGNVLDEWNMYKNHFHIQLILKNVSQAIKIQLITIGCPRIIGNLCINAFLLKNVL